MYLSFFEDHDVIHFSIYWLDQFPKFKFWILYNFRFQPFLKYVVGYFFSYSVVYIFILLIISFAAKEHFDFMCFNWVSPVIITWDPTVLLGKPLNAPIVFPHGLCSESYNHIFSSFSIDWCTTHKVRIQFHLLYVNWQDFLHYLLKSLSLFQCMVSIPLSTSSVCSCSVLLYS